MTLHLAAARLSVVLALVVFAALVAASCGAAPSSAPPVTAAAPRAVPTTLIVLAASSLTAAFTDMGKAFEAANPSATVIFSLAGSQALRTQLEQGARADVFASADVSNMTQATTAGVIQGASVVFARNKLVAIAPLSGATSVKDFNDLAKPGLKLVIADAGVPAGSYALQVIDKYAADPAYGADFKTQALARVVSRENSVKQVVGKVVLGEADAGIVYATDAQAERGKLAVIAIPDQYNVIAEYAIAVVKGSSNAALAQSFIGFVRSAAGQAIMATYGFASP